MTIRTVKSNIVHRHAGVSRPSFMFLTRPSHRTFAIEDMILNVWDNEVMMHDAN